MATVNVSITTKKQSVPQSPQASSNLWFTLLKEGAVIQVVNCNLPNLSVTFENVTDGTYTVSVQRMNQGVLPQSGIGDAAVSTPFVVVNTVEIDVPDVISVVI